MKNTLSATMIAAALLLPIGAGVSFATDADNTAKNTRDRDDKTLTPMDQGGSESDRTITQDIRKAVMAKDGMSTNAQNVKIITVESVVTLRGPVKTPDEKSTIVALATKTAGVKRVDDQLEVEQSK